MFKSYLLLCFMMIPSVLSAQTPNSDVPLDDANKWKTTGFRQANSMGGGEAAISNSGKFRVFVLMGQSNMHGVARAAELEAPYNEKHDRIRIWANATTINHGRLPVLDDGIHFNAEGQIKLGKMVASAVETFYQEKP